MINARREVSGGAALDVELADLSGQARNLACGIVFMNETFGSSFGNYGNGLGQSLVRRLLIARGHFLTDDELHPSYQYRQIRVVRMRRRAAGAAGAASADEAKAESKAA